MNLTNQQLAFARAQLDAAERANAPFVRRAHWQAAVWQLSLALESYASELQDAAKAKFPLHTGLRMFSHLLEACAAADKHSRELEELARLEQMPESWLNQLQRWGQHLLTLGVGEGASVLAETSLTAAEQPQTDHFDLIHVDSGTTEEKLAPVNQEQLRWVLDQASTLIERQRDNSWEY